MLVDLDCAAVMMDLVPHRIMPRIMVPRALIQCRVTRLVVLVEHINQAHGLFMVKLIFQVQLFKTECSQESDLERLS